jgi:uncharacterized protein YndB with AHSA1/START domain
VPSAQSAFFFIADISGYTRYLTESELEHAQGILTTLLELLVNHTRPPLVVSQLEGDAVFSYGRAENFLLGQTFVEKIEQTYIAFRRAIESMVLNNTCKCRACANISSLDLKFFVHYGTVSIQRVGEREELLGSDVIVIHRLMKNHVVEQTGMRAYCLYTNAAVQQLGLGALLSGLSEHTETYEHLGEVKVWVQDMHPVWQHERETHSVEIAPGQVAVRVTTDIALPPEVVWDYMSRPEFLQTLYAAAQPVTVRGPSGRVGSGHVFQCYHGDHLLPITIVEWRPLKRLLTHGLMPIPIPNTYARVDCTLELTAAGTRLTQVFTKATSGPWLGRQMISLMMPLMSKSVQRDLDKFKHQVEADFAARFAVRVPAAAMA